MKINRLGNTFTMTKEMLPEQPEGETFIEKWARTNWDTLERMKIDRTPEKQPETYFIATASDRDNEIQYGKGVVIRVTGWVRFCSRVQMAWHGVRRFAIRVFRTRDCPENQDEN